MTIPSDSHPVYAGREELGVRQLTIDGMAVDFRIQRWSMHSESAALLDLTQLPPAVPVLTARSAQLGMMLEYPARHRTVWAYSIEELTTMWKGSHGA